MFFFNINSTKTETKRNEKFNWKDYKRQSLQECSLNLLDCTKCKKWIWPVMLSPCQRWTLRIVLRVADICGLCAEIRTTKICPCTFVTDCLLNVKTEQLKSGSSIRIICLYVILCNDMWPHFQRILLVGYAVKLCTYVSNCYFTASKTN